MSKRILVVEDHEDSRRILRDLLTSAGFQMLEAEDGEQGIAAAETQRPDLILMDIQLPVVDGYEATRRIKANPALKAIPIIVVTSYTLDRRHRHQADMHALADAFEATVGRRRALGVVVLDRA